MAFFDFLTGNSNAKRDVKNAQKDQQNEQAGRATEAYNTSMPWIKQAQEQASSLFNPGGVTSSNAMLDKSFGQQQGALDSMHSGLDAEAANPGYSAGEQRDIRLGAIAPVAGAYGSLSGETTNHAALTGNPNGWLPAQQEIARQKARDISLAGTGVAKSIADKRIEGSQHATAGYGTEAAGRSQVNADAENRLSGERANVNAGLLPAQTLTPYFAGSNAAATDLQNPQYQNATAPGFLRQAALATISGGANTLTGAGIKALGG
jgi:hypothetical protein